MGFEVGQGVGRHSRISVAATVVSLMVWVGWCTMFLVSTFHPQWGGMCHECFFFFLVWLQREGRMGLKREQCPCQVKGSVTCEHLCRDYGLLLAFILPLSPFIVSGWCGSDRRAEMVWAEHRLPQANSEVSSFRLAIFVPIKDSGQLNMLQFSTSCVAFVYHQL